MTSDNQKLRDALTSWDYENGISAAQFDMLPIAGNTAAEGLEVVLDANGCWISSMKARIILGYLASLQSSSQPSAGKCYDCGGDPEALCLACRSKSQPSERSGEVEREGANEALQWAAFNDAKIAYREAFSAGRDSAVCLRKTIRKYLDSLGLDAQGKPYVATAPSRVHLGRPQSECMDPVEIAKRITIDWDNYSEKKKQSRIISCRDTIAAMGFTPHTPDLKYLPEEVAIQIMQDAADKAEDGVDFYYTLPMLAAYRALLAAMKGA